MKLHSLWKKNAEKRLFEMYKADLLFFFFFECNRLEVNSQVASAAARLLFRKTDASSKGFPPVLGERTNSEPLWARRASTLSTSGCSTPFPPLEHSAQTPCGQE